MMLTWIDDLDDPELYARLVQHGVKDTRARDLVAGRDDWACSGTILDILDPDLLEEGA